MAITTAISTSFLIELPVKGHDFTTATGDDFRFALFTSVATLGATTTAYAATNEVSGTGYTAGGALSASATPVEDTGVCVFDFADVQWTSATITARGAQLYNDSAVGKPSVAIWDFGSDKTASGGNFDLTMPVADAANAILRLA